MSEHSRRKVSYFYDHDIGSFHFGRKHPMKPIRIVMAHNLIVNYGLYKNMSVYRPHKASCAEINKFHKEDYLLFLRSVDKTTVDRISNELKNLMTRFNLDIANDCPVFEGVFSFSQLCAGGSLSAAANINRKDSDIAINWSGGLHHAKKSEASGFCYINDIVLCILELLKFHQRVLYVDLDVHHGDGVEEAFFTCDRVMTVSFHRFGNGYFPGTGSLNEIGAGKGKYYSVNVPLNSGITDKDYKALFAHIMTKVMEVYGPSVIVIQCGSDSLAHDRLGDFNLTLRAHGYCIDFLRKYNIPIILLGGGGYTVQNVSRCWCYDTSVALNIDIKNELPQNEFWDYFKSNPKLHIEPRTDLKNNNSCGYLRDVVIAVHENLRNVQPVPSVQVFDTVPAFSPTSDETIEENADIRLSVTQKNLLVLPQNEFYDEED